MKFRYLSILLLILAPCVLHAQAAQVRNGDALELHLSGVPAPDSAAFNAVYTVDDQGMINLPLIGQVKVTGLLPNEIQATIQKLYIEGKIYTHPTITLQQSQQRFVNVIGEVKGAQRVLYTPDLTLMSAITACAGFSDYADKKHVELMRAGQKTVYNTEDIRKGKTADPKLVPGDQVTVKASFW